MRTDKIFPVLVSGGVIALVLAIVALLGPQLHQHPYVVAEAPNGLTVTFLKPGRNSLSECQAVTAGMVKVFLANCTNCVIRKSGCLGDLSPEQEKLFTTEPIDIPSSRLRGGVVTYVSSPPAIAQAACQESEWLATRNDIDHRVTCFQPGTPRPLVNQQLPPIEASQVGFGLLMLFVSGIISWLACYLLVRYEHLHAHLSQDPIDSGPQKFHTTPTPRIGGIAVLLGLLLANLVLVATERQFPVENFGFMLLAVLPAFGGGLLEDLTKKCAVSSRLILTMVAAALGAWLLGAVLPRVDIPAVDPWLAWAPLAVAFTIFAVGGVGNAMNIVDGYNGLAAGYGLLVLIPLTWVAGHLGDVFLMTTGLTMIGALAGFLLWNYPRGRIFLGDGGAYLLGFWLAELSVLLVVRHPEVSAWFPMLLLIYPVFETLFTIVRRKLLNGKSPGEPDSLHLHQLIYRCLSEPDAATAGRGKSTLRNSRVAPRIWAASLCYLLPGLVFWRQTGWLAGLAAGACALYLGAYLWLRKKGGLGSNLIEARAAATPD